MKTLLLLLGSALSAAAQQPSDYPLPEAPSQDAVSYTADHFEYMGSTTGADAQMRLRGNVEVKDSSWTLRAKELDLDLAAQEARARNGFEIDDGIDRLYGDRGDFDLVRRTGHVLDVRSEYSPWRIWAREAELDERRHATFRHAAFTSCGGDPPHYFFRASRVHIERKRWLYAMNVRVHLGPVPVFYSPFLWKSLKSDRLIKTRMSFSYDRRNGGGARSTTGFQPFPWLGGKLFLDYYTSQGLASGGELITGGSEDAKGAAYGYRIREDSPKRERWTVLGSYYQTLGSSFSVQGRMQAQADPEVNNHYVRSNAFRVTSELVNGAALVRRTDITTTRLSVSRGDVSDGTRERFMKVSESLPRLDFNTAPMALPRVPLLFNLSAFADNRLERAMGFAKRSAGARAEVTQTLRLRKGLSFTPRAAFREVYENRTEAWTSFRSTRTYRDTFTGYYEFGTNVRTASPVGDWDAGYAFERRMKPGCFQDDAGGMDYGVERNLVTLQDTVRPTRSTLFRLSSGYSFRRFRDYTLGLRSKVEPIVGDVTLAPGRGWSLSGRAVQDLDVGNLHTIVQAERGDRESDFLAFSLGHSRDKADMYIGAIEAGWTPEGTGVSFQGAVRSLARTPGGADLRGFQVYEKELSITRDFHDFHTRVLVRFRPGGIKEVLFKVNLLAERKKEPKKRVDWSKIWFPWRKGKTEDADDRE